MDSIINNNNSIMFCTIPSNILFKIRKVFLNWGLNCIKLVSKYFKYFKYLNLFSNNIYIIFPENKNEDFWRLHFFIKFNLDNIINNGVKLNGFFFKGLFIDNFKFFKADVLVSFFYNLNYILVLNYIIFYFILNILFSVVRIFLKKYV